jgi:hypothetical protein
MSSAKNWQTKDGALLFITTLVSRGPLQICACLIDIVPKARCAAAPARTTLLLRQLARRVRAPIP